MKGTDKFGNKYYENVELPYGQHRSTQLTPLSGLLLFNFIFLFRWVEYANIHDPDPTMIQPEWHGWMHHVFDHTPAEKTLGVGVSDGEVLTDASHAIFGMLLY